MDLVNRYIKVTRENEKEVLKALEELGFVWCDGDKLSEFSTFNGYSSKYSDTHFIQIISDNKVNFCTKEIFLDSNIRNKEINFAHLKSFCKDNMPDGKLEFPKIIRNLRDLDGLKNDKGWELSFESTDNFKDKGYYQEWVRLDDKSNKGWFNAFYELTDKTIDLLKTGGFEFEYKPLRSLEEVLDEARTKIVKFVNGEYNYLLVKTLEGYSVDRDVYLERVDSLYLCKETAQKYADELNEILGGNND